MKRIILVGKDELITHLSSFFLKERYEVINVDEITSLECNPNATLIINESLDNYKNKQEWQKKIFNITKSLKGKIGHLIILTSVIKSLRKISKITKRRDNLFRNLEMNSLKLQDENYLVSIVNLPIVFGKDISSKYYQMMHDLALKSWIYPHINNKLSMIYIENLFEFMCQIIDKNITGDLYPCDRDYSLTDVGNFICRANKSKARLSYFANVFYKISSLFSLNRRIISSNSCFPKFVSKNRQVPDYHKYTNHDAIFLSENYQDVIKSRFDLQRNLVSIITPLYNSEKYIAKTIESVLHQTYQNFEMIIVDDVSSDNSYQIVEEYAKKDPRIKLYKLSKNGGSSKARNEAMRCANGEYVCFLDSDDLYAPTFLEEQVYFMKSKMQLATYSTYQMFSDNGKWMFKAGKKSTYHSQNYKRNLSALATIYNRRQLGTIYMREDLLKAEDYIYWFELLEIVKVIYCNNKCLAYYRITPNSKSRNKKALIKYMWDVFHKYERHLVITSLFYMFVWGVSGLRKYRKVK